MSLLCLGTPYVTYGSGAEWIECILLLAQIGVLGVGVRTLLGVRPADTQQ